MDELKANYKRAKRAYKRAKRKYVSFWKTIALFCAILTVILMYVAMGDMIGLWVPSLLTENGVVFASVQMVLALAVVILQFRFYRNGFPLRLADEVPVCI